MLYYADRSKKHVKITFQIPIYNMFNIALTSNF